MTLTLIPPSPEATFASKLREDRETLRKAARTLRVHGFDDNADRFVRIAAVVSRLIGRAEAELGIPATKVRP